MKRLMAFDKATADAAMKVLSLSPDAVADRIGVTEADFKYILGGFIPGPSTRGKMAAALKLCPQDLWVIFTTNA